MLTDSLGRRVDFKNTIMIMTSNVGTRDLKQGGGFGFGISSSENEYGAMKSTIEDSLKRVFNPEFLNRIDEAIIFHQLEKRHIVDIVQIQVADLLKRMASMNITLELTKQAREFLAEKGYDPAYGARPLRRAIQRHLEDPIAEEVLKGKFGEQTTIRVGVSKKSGELKFSKAGTEDKAGEVNEEEESADVK